MKLRTVRLQRFKRIEDANFDVDALNVLVGSNNSGKSSIIQGMHFAIALLQNITLEKRWSYNDSLSTSINPNQLIYSPSQDAYALGLGGHLSEPETDAIKITFTLDTGEVCSIIVRKGRNRNILVAVEHAFVAKRLSHLQILLVSFRRDLQEFRSMRISFLMAY